jgi:hypothetical protein
VLRLDLDPVRLGSVEPQPGDREIDPADVAQQPDCIFLAARLQQGDHDLGALAAQPGDRLLAGGHRVVELDPGDSALGDHAEHAGLGAADLDHPGRLCGDLRDIGDHPRQSQVIEPLR